MSETDSLRISTPAEVLGRSHKRVFLKLNALWPTRILTMPDSVLPRGAKTALRVEVLVDPHSLRYSGNYIVADLEVTDVLEKRETGTDAGEPS